MNQYDNENVEVADVRGAIAPDLHGAFAEWRAQAKATDCKKYLYSLSINPDQSKYDLTRDQYIEFITRAEKKLGLTDQPRAIIFHTKNGRQHCHTVWSRIDTDNMKALQLSHDRQKLRTVAQDFARDHNLELPPGMRRDRGKDRLKDRQKVASLAEKQQQERTGETKEQRQSAISAAWKHSDNAQAFIHALESRGYHIARGDKRGFVVVDRYGEVHSLSRQLQGVKAAELKARLDGFEPPTLDQAQETVRLKQEKKAEQDKARDSSRRREELAEQKRQQFEAMQAARRQALDKQRADMDGRHVTERLALRELHSAQDDKVRADRAARQPKGLTRFLTRITGIQILIARRHQKQDQEREASRKIETEALGRRHDRERQEMDRQAKNLAMVEEYERHSFETKMARDRLREVLKDHRIDLTADFARAAEEEKARKEAGERKSPKPDFDRAAAPPAKEPVHDSFHRAVEHAPPAAEPAAPPTPSLQEAFERRAAQKERQGRDQGPERSIQPPGSDRTR